MLNAYFDICKLSGTLIREITILTPTATSDRQKRLRYSLEARINLIQEEITNKIKELNWFLPNPAPRIELKQHSLPPGMSIQNHLQKHCNPEEFRIFIQFEDPEQYSSGSPVDLLDKGISHLVEIKLNGSNSGWHPCSNIADTALTIKESEVTRAIIDICLDIAAYNSYAKSFPFLQEVKTRREINHNKIVALQKTENKTAYGPIYAGAKYVSAASFFHANGSYDFKELAKCWDDILAEHITDLRFSFDTLLKKNRQKGQLPSRKMMSLLECLPKGEYVFLRSNKEPKSSHKKTQILTVLGGNSWRAGIIKIVSFNTFTLNNILRFHPYVTFFFVRKP